MAADAAAQLPVLLLEPREPQRVLDRQQQLVGRDRLLEEIGRAEPRRADRHVHRRLPRDHDDRRRHAELAQLGEHGQAVLPRHHDVGEDDVEALLLQERYRARRLIADDRFVAGEAERARERRERRLIVVHDQHARHAEAPFAASAFIASACMRGSSRWNVEPRPRALSTQTRPPWSATTDWTIARPRPVPCCLVV